MVVINDGKSPTFRRGASTSYIDVTLASQGTASKITGWAVLDEESFTDHGNITFQVRSGGRNKPTLVRSKIVVESDKFKSLLGNSAAAVRVDSSVATLENLGETIKTVQDACTIKRGYTVRRVPYWWNEDIEAARTACTASRRNLLRNNRRGETREARRSREEYRNLKKVLRKSIQTSKREHWKQLCNQLEDDIWGDGYRLVTKHLTNPSPAYNLVSEKKLEIASQLFPARDDHWREEQNVSAPRPFSMEELLGAGAKLKSNKAPGPDGVLPDTVKTALEVASEWILDVLNKLLEHQLFPDIWKVARLVLLPKSGKPPGSPEAYRPICLLDALCKLYEILLRDRIEEELESTEGLAQNQYGFRKGRSTIQAARRSRPR